MAQPQTEAVIRQIITQEGVAQGWTANQVQNSIDDFIALTNRAEAGDIAAQQLMDEFFAQAGEGAPAWQAHTTPSSPDFPQIYSRPQSPPAAPPPPITEGIPEGWREVYNPETGKTLLYKPSYTAIDDQGFKTVIPEQWRDVGTVSGGTGGMAPGEEELAYIRALETEGYPLSDDDKRKILGLSGTTAAGGPSSSKLRDLQWARTNNLISEEDYTAALGSILGGYAGGGGAAPSLSPYQAGQLELGRGNLAVSQRAQDRSELEAQIQAAQTAQPISWLSLRRGIAPGAGGTDVYRGRSQIAPVLSDLGGQAATPRLSAPPQTPSVVDPLASTAQRGVTAPASTPSRGQTPLAAATNPYHPESLYAALEDAQQAGIPAGGSNSPSLRAPVTTSAVTTPTRTAAAVGSTGLPAPDTGGIWEPVPPSPVSQAIAAGREIKPASLPPGIRVPGLQAQARMDPFEVSALEEEAALRGVPPASWQWQLARARRGVGPAPQTRSYGGRLRAPRVA